jgi:hypothetical protein
MSRLQCQAGSRSLHDWWAFKSLDASLIWTVEWFRIDESLVVIPTFRPGTVLVDKFSMSADADTFWRPGRPARAAGLAPGILAIEGGDVGDVENPWDDVADDALGDLGGNMDILDHDDDEALVDDDNLDEDSLANGASPMIGTFVRLLILVLVC